MICEISFTH